MVPRVNSVIVHMCEHALLRCMMIMGLLSMLTALHKADLRKAVSP